MIWNRCKSLMRCQLVISSLLLFSVRLLCQIRDSCRTIRTRVCFESFVCIWLMINAECWLDSIRRSDILHNQSETKDFDCWRKMHRWKLSVVANFYRVSRIWDLVPYSQFAISIVVQWRDIARSDSDCLCCVRKIKWCLGLTNWGYVCTSCSMRYILIFWCQFFSDHISEADGWWLVIFD